MGRRSKKQPEREDPFDEGGQGAEDPDEGRTNKRKTTLVIEKSEDLAELAQDMIGQDFPNLAHARIQCVSKTHEEEDGDIPPPEAGSTFTITARLFSPMDRAVFRLDFRLVANGNWMHYANDNQVHGQLFHALCGLDLVEGKPVTVKPMEVHLREIREIGVHSEPLEQLQAAFLQLSLDFAVEPEAEATLEPEAQSALAEQIAAQ